MAAGVADRNWARPASLCAGRSGSLVEGPALRWTVRAASRTGRLFGGRRSPRVGRGASWLDAIRHDEDGTGREEDGMRRELDAVNFSEDGSALRWTAPGTTWTGPVARRTASAIRRTARLSGGRRRSRSGRRRLRGGRDRRMLDGADHDLDGRGRSEDGVRRVEDGAALWRTAPAARTIGSAETWTAPIARRTEPLVAPPIPSRRSRPRCVFPSPRSRRTTLSIAPPSVSPP